MKQEIQKEIQKEALFTNFSIEEFIGYWNGRPEVFAPGQSKYMSDNLARHYAKHLVNRELIRKDGSGNPIYPNGEQATSPKIQEDVPMFMKLFNKAYTPDEKEQAEEMTVENVEALTNATNKNRELEKKEVTPKPKEDEENDSPNPESFEGKPVEEKPVVKAEPSTELPAKQTESSPKK